MFLSQGGWIQAEITVHLYTVIQCLSHTCNIRTLLIALLALPMFLLYKVRPPCRWYVLSNLATGCTSLGVPDMLLEDYLYSYQTKLEILSQRELPGLKNNFR